MVLGLGLKRSHLLFQMNVCNTPSPSWKFCLMPSHLKKKPNSRRVWLPTGPGYQLCASFGLGLRAWLSCSLLGLARDIFFQYMQLRRQEIIGPQGWFLWFIVVIRKEMLQKKSWCFLMSWAKFGGFQPKGLLLTMGSPVWFRFFSLCGLPPSQWKGDTKRCFKI